MRISELQSHLARLKAQYGNCSVVIEDESVNPERLISYFTIGDTVVEDESGDGYDVVSIRISPLKENPLSKKLNELARQFEYTHGMVRELLGEALAEFEGKLREIGESQVRG